MSMIMGDAAVLLGHHNGNDATIVSSHRGQVVYPAFFESSNFMAKGYLQLCVFPGFLNMNGMRFDRMLDDYWHIGATYLNESVRSAHYHHIKVPATFVPHRPTHSFQPAMRWRTSVFDDQLQGSLVLDNGQNGSFGGWNLIRTMGDILLSPPCEHEPDSPAGDLAPRFFFGGNFKAPGPRPLLLLSAGRDYRTQLYRLAQMWSCAIGFGHSGVLVHTEGCIRCALQLCCGCSDQERISLFGCGSRANEALRRSDRLFMSRL